MNILSLPVLLSDHRIPYGPDPSQFGDLWLPETNASGRFPLVVFYHGGWWKSEYDLGYAGYLCAALKREGIATWSVEYRRVGSTGGGWPMTFQDAAAGFDYRFTLAKTYPLDLTRVITAGHSAGGHLAFWLAGKRPGVAHRELFVRGPRPGVLGTVALAGAVDLRLILELADLPQNSVFAHDREEVYGLMGGGPKEFPDRYSEGNPGDLLPFHAPQILVQGTEDDQIPPELPARWEEMSRRLGSHATVNILPGADHFDVVDPASSAWGNILALIKRALGMAEV